MEIWGSRGGWASFYSPYGDLELGIIWGGLQVNEMYKDTAMPSGDSHIISFTITFSALSTHLQDFDLPPLPPS
jgi:hypothetical protein